MSVDVLTMSSKGQVVLPAPIRKALSLVPGSRLAVYASDGAILLRPIDVPSEEQLGAWLEEMRDWADSVGYAEADVDAAIAEVRAERRA